MVRNAVSAAGRIWGGTDPGCCPGMPRWRPEVLPVVGVAVHLPLSRRPWRDRHSQRIQPRHRHRCCSHGGLLRLGLRCGRRRGRLTLCSGLRPHLLSHLVEVDGGHLPAPALSRRAGPARAGAAAVIHAGFHRRLMGARQQHERQAVGPAGSATGGGFHARRRHGRRRGHRPIDRDASLRAAARYIYPHAVNGSIPKKSVQF